MSVATPVSGSGTNVAQSMLAEIEHEFTTTRKFLERVPNDKLTWKPHEKSMTAGQLALHIAQVPAAVLNMSMNDEFPPPRDMVFAQPGSVKEILDTLEASAAAVRAELPKVNDARMQAMLRVADDGKELLAMPRVAFLRMIMLNHWYHHRGQLGVYLRLLGAKVPSAYGPSGDESPF